jgi:phage terminase large subunit-like protein
VVVDDAARKAELRHRYCAAAKFSYFFEEIFWPVIEPTTPLHLCDAHQFVLESLQCWATGSETGEIPRFADGDLTIISPEGYPQNLTVQVAPRFGKSNICTIALPCWIWLWYPSARFLFASFSVSLSTDHAKKRRKLLQSEQYQRIRDVPLVNADPRNLENKYGGVLVNAAKDSSTGKGCDYLILDDLASASATTVEIANSVYSYKHGLKSRLNSSARGRKLNISQRVSAGDVVATCLLEGWHQIKFEMQATKDLRLLTPITRTELHIPTGRILNPARDSQEFVDSLKKDKELWTTQYQNSPAPPEGLLYKLDQFLPSTEVAPEFILVSVDSANSSSDTSAYWAVTVWALAADGTVTLLQVIRQRWDYATGRAGLSEVLTSWQPHYCLIENKSSGQSLLSELQTGTLFLPHSTKLVPINPRGSKADRARLSLSMHPIQYVEGDWTVDFFEEILQFPRSATQDQVDSVSQLLNWLRGLKLEALTGTQLHLISKGESLESDIIRLYRALR